MSAWQTAEHSNLWKIGEELLEEHYGKDSKLDDPHTPEETQAIFELAKRKAWRRIGLPLQMEFPNSVMIFFVVGVEVTRKRVSSLNGVTV